MSLADPKTGCPTDWDEIVKQTDFYESNNNLPIPSNPDIGSIGVLVAFVASAYLTLVLVFVYYASGCRSNGTPPNINRIDGHFIRKASRWPGMRAIARKKSTWEPLLRLAVLMYSDQQLIAGIAILLSAYSQLGMDLTSYHWQLMVYLAWFASLSHLTTLTALQSHFREDGRSRNLRVGLMAITLLMLLAALVPTADKDWQTYAGGSFTGAIRTICFYKRAGTGVIDSHDQNGVTFIVSVFILVFSGMTRALKLHNRSSSWVQRYLCTQPRQWIHARLKRLINNKPKYTWSWLWKIHFAVLCTCYLVPKAMHDIYVSMFWEVWWLFVGLLHGLLRLSLSRAPSDNAYWGAPHEKAPEDDKWTFGQGIAIIFLALPWLSLYGNSSGIGKGLETPEHNQHISDGSKEDAVHSPLDHRQPILLLGRSVGIVGIVDQAESSHEPGSLVPDNPAIPVMLSTVKSTPIPSIRGIPSQNQRTTDAEAQSEDAEATESHTPNFVPPSLSQPKFATLFLDPYRYEWFRLLLRMELLCAFYTVLNIVIAANIGSTPGVQVFLVVLLGLIFMLLCIAIWTFSCLGYEMSMATKKSLSNQLVGKPRAYWKHKTWKICYWFLLAVAMGGATIQYYMLGHSVL